MDKETMSLMVEDFIFSGGEELSGLVLDGEPYFDEESDEWRQDAHDEQHTYILFPCDGEIIIAYGGTR